MLGLFANHILFLMPLQYHLKIVFRYLHVCFVEITTQKCFKCFYGRTTNEKTFSYFTWPFWIYVTPIILITRNNIYTKTVVFIKYNSSYEHSSRKVGNGYQSFLFFQYIMSGYDSFSRHVCDITFIISTQPKCLF